MQSSKLFTLLRGLTSSEMRWLYKFLRSPFYNSNAHVLKLFEYIKKYYPNLDSPKLAKEVAYKYLFPKQKFTPQRMRKLMHELATLVEDFMVAQHFKENQFDRKKVLTKEFGARNLYGLFEKNSVELVNELDNLPYRDNGYYLEKYQTEYQYFAHPSTNLQEYFFPKLLSLSENLDGFYFLQKLQLNAVLESAKKIYKVDEKLTFLEEIKIEIKKQNLSANPIFSLYLLVNQLFTNKDQERIFNKLYEYFLLQKQNLSIKDKETILKYLINYCTNQLNKGKDEYVSKQFGLYKIALADKSFLIKSFMTESTFINISWAGSFLKEFQFVEHFIENYQQFLNKDLRSKITLLCYAYLYFNKGNYAKTIDLLSKETFAKVVDKLRVKTLLLKSYFELYQQDESYYNLVNTKLGNFERLIRRDSLISMKRKDGYFNFIKFLKKIIEFKLKKTNLVDIQKEVLAATNISNKPWLLEKINHT